MAMRVACLALLVAVASCSNIPRDARLTAEPAQLEIAAAQVCEALRYCPSSACETVSSR